MVSMLALTLDSRSRAFCSAVLFSENVINVSNAGGKEYNMLTSQLLLEIIVLALELLHLLFDALHVRFRALKILENVFLLPLHFLLLCGERTKLGPLSCQSVFQRCDCMLGSFKFLMFCQ
jgi:hypothetical protein